MKTILILLFSLNCFSVFAYGILGDDPMRLPDGVEELYIKGLNYLKKTQREDGGWEGHHYSGEPGVVGLCVLAFLAHGDDAEVGPYSKNIKRGIAFIIKNMKPENGYIGNSMYNHGFATLALAESYGVLQDERIGPALEKAVALIISAQNRNPHGGWRYTPDSQDADTTVSGACMLALFAAANAGIKVPDENIKKGLEFYRTCQSSDGGFGYTNTQGANTIRTGIGSLVFALAKEKKSKEYFKIMGYLKGSGSESIEESYLFYGLYYISQAFFHYDPIAWENWNLINIKFLKNIQNEDGSWDSSFGREFSTASALLSLALNYRYLPIYEK